MCPRTHQTSARGQHCELLLFTTCAMVYSVVWQQTTGNGNNGMGQDRTGSDRTGQAFLVIASRLSHCVWPRRHAWPRLTQASHMRRDRWWIGLQVALVHGGLEKIWPHSSTGRADYFGSTVNRAARLLCAAKPGQILAEAPVMDAVLKQWLGISSQSSLHGANGKSATWRDSDFSPPLLRRRVHRAI